MIIFIVVSIVLAGVSINLWNNVKKLSEKNKSVEKEIENREKLIYKEAKIAAREALNNEIEKFIEKADLNKYLAEG